MLAEASVQMMQYNEKTPASGPDTRQRRTNSLRFGPLRRDLGKCWFEEPEPGPNLEGSSSPSSHLGAPSPGGAGLSIPGQAPGRSPETVLCSSCSLLDRYTDLQMLDTGLVTLSPARPVKETASSPPSDLRPGPAELRPDQGYLVVGHGSDHSLPGSRLEPMSNSLLNGLLDQQLEEVYLQHLTENLARCNSQLGNSLLHGLVPPPKPSACSQGAESLDVSLDRGPGGRSGSQVSHLCTQLSGPCSSNFSSPVLRISETEGAPK